MIVVDTHILLWWINSDSTLSKAARAAIDSERPGGTILVSAITAWEIAMLVKQGKVGLLQAAHTWMRRVAEIPAVRIVPVEMDIAIQSVDLAGDFHKDPADRIIVATAQKYAVPLVTADAKIRAYPHVETIW
jgi:PIN domain nuclease of toxin-antitoxin system